MPVAEATNSSEAQAVQIVMARVLVPRKRIDSTSGRARATMSGKRLF